MPKLHLRFPLILALCCCAALAQAQQLPAPKFGIGLAGASWGFPFNRTSAEAPFDVRLRPTLSAEIQFHYYPQHRLWLSAAAGLLPSSLKTDHLYDIFSHTRHQAKSAVGWSQYLLAGVGINFLPPEKEERLLLTCRAGYFFNQVPEVDERYISLQDYRQREVAYRFSRGGGAVWQPGFLVITSTSAAGFAFQASGFAHFSATPQDFSRSEQGDLAGSGRFRTYYNGFAFQIGALYLIQNRKL